MSKTKPVEFDTDIQFDAQAEVHAGRKVVVVTKKITRTPRSGRGKEWGKAVQSTETQVLDMYDARRLVQAVTDAFYYAAGDTIEDETEPRFFVTHRTIDGDPKTAIGARHFFVYTQAEEFAASLVEANPSETYVVRRIDGGDFDIVSVWNAEKVGVQS